MNRFEEYKEHVKDIIGYKTLNIYKEYSILKVLDTEDIVKIGNNITRLSFYLDELAYYKIISERLLRDVDFQNLISLGEKENWQERADNYLSSAVEKEMKKHQ